MRVGSVPDNLLLRTASRAGRTTGQLKHVAFDTGERLWTSEAAIGYALFPVRGVISLQVSPRHGKLVDIGLVGREGCVEVAYFFGADQSRTIAVALTPGEGLAMRPDLFSTYLSDARFREALHMYVRMFLVMLNRFSACNRVHVIEKTFIGRLLLLQDRAQTDSFQLTQDFFSRVLGVRKATISRAAARLQKQGIISYDRRGRLTILDRSQLERQACSCYRTIKADSDGLIAAMGGF
jgi:CRP-like cAMP-binding protein